ncbi:MAG: tryptophan synthase subunit alpha [Dehalococcoidia bacterium]|nr:tryptophan synthase subunit alpha [Dehalococcoidia bacterium]
MNTLGAAFAQPGRKALIAYVTVGCPDVDTTVRLVALLAENGCDIVELGIPFSDPLADGATIQMASHVALQNGVTPEVCLDVASRLSGSVQAPLVFMSYYNPMLRRGLDSFCGAAVAAGVSGLIVPDLPPDEGMALEDSTSRRGMDLIYLVAPSTTEERLAYVAQRSRGFLYMVSLTGVTGTRNSLGDGLESFVARARKATELPLCVGFGISSAPQAARVARIADGVIVGSRLLQLVEQDRSLDDVTRFVRELRSAIDGAGT